MHDHEIKQWDHRLLNQVNRGWDNYKHLRIDLSTARLDQSYLIAGEYLYVEAVSSADAIAKIRLNRTTNDQLDLEDGVKIETIYVELFVTNDALEGEWIDLIFGINFKYKKKAPANGLAGGLKKTQQTIVYQAGDDGTYQAGLAFDYTPQTIGGDDVVIDNVTGLMWAADANAAGCNNGATLTWPNAIIYAEALNFAGFDDWRLPNIKELCSLINYSLFFPCIDEPPFANFPNGAFWSSTTRRASTTNAWRLNFSNGAVSWLLKAGTHDIVCVRGGL